MFIRIFSGMASKLILLNHGDQGWFQLKVVTSTAGCLTVEYSAWMKSLQKSSIVSYIGGLAAASCSTVCSILSSAMLAFFALLTFLKLLSVLSNSVSTRNRSDSSFLGINYIPEMEIY